MPPPEQVTRELLPSWSEEWLITQREECRLQQLNALEESARALGMDVAQLMLPADHVAIP